MIRIHNQAPAGPAADYDDNESDERPFISYEITGADSVEDSGKSDFEDIYIGEDPNQTFGSPIPAGYVEEFGPHKRENEYVVSRNSSYEAEIIDNSSDDGISDIKDKSEVPDARNISNLIYRNRTTYGSQRQMP